MGILSHPFRIADTGAVVTVDEGTTAAAAEAVAVLALTRLGERRMVPAFGVSDPAFDGYDAGELSAGLSQWGPDGVTVESVDTEWENDTTAVTTITFEEEDPS
ncbi:hypothetical protein [Jiangella muralis]|uniref:hypothetical protein n=1 Tax=Jiangella muralis TaxID=702383 RepID=UPI00069EB34D|nr:hypothetical protein [Jiangella muralis]